MQDQAKAEQALPQVQPGAFNVNPLIVVDNKTDEEGNPTGGNVQLEIVRRRDGGTGAHGAIHIYWQDGPRGKNEAGELEEPNGAFVEDVIYAALQRLQFFQDSKFKSDYNQRAIRHLLLAVEALNERSAERAKAGTLGSYDV